MTKEDIAKLSGSEAKELLEKIFDDGYKARMYLSLSQQLDNINSQLEGLEFNIQSKDDKQIVDYILEMAEKASKISESMDKFLSTINKDTLEQEKKAKNRAKLGSVESFTLNHGRKA
jgi:superfamily II RNA helicase